MHQRFHELTAQTQIPTRHLLAFNMGDTGRVLGSPIDFIEFSLIDPKGVKERRAESNKPCLVVCVHGEIEINWQDDPNTILQSRMLSSEPDSDNLVAAHFERESFRIENRSSEEAIILVFATDDVLVLDDPLVRFNAFLVGLNLGHLNWMYLVNMQVGGTPAGNHWHEHRAEQLVALHGDFMVGTKNMDLDEEDSFLLSATSRDGAPRVWKIPPRTAHAVLNASDHTARLIVFSSGMPRDGDDHEYVIFTP